MKLARRTFLQATTLLTGTALLRPLHARAAQKKFPVGVASGDPLSDRVILWTKINLQQDQEQVRFQVSRNKNFRKITQEGELTASRKTDGIVKFDCTGLEAGQTYYYRFIAGSERSITGRTKTLPVGDVDKIKIAICSCANYGSGFYTAYRAMAERSDIDVVLHLGDYIYEYANQTYGKLKARSIRPQGECLTLADYRARYQHYRSDPDLQKLHAQHPMIAVWDDHEIANNGFRSGAQNHSPETEGSWEARERAARQAYFEWLPIRPRKNKIYRRFTFGSLATLMMVDTRYDDRDKEYTLAHFLRRPKNKKSYFDKAAYDKAIHNPRRAIMSNAQRLWLKNELKRAAQNTRWSLIGNQIPFQPVYIAPITASKDAPDFIKQIAGLQKLAKAAGLKKIPLSLDEWAGFPAAQAQLVNTIEKAAAPTLVLTGDTHHGWATFYGNKTGLELGTPGISSPGTEAYFPKEALPGLKRRFLKNNPSFLFRDLEHRGFLLLEVERNQAQAQWVWVNTATRRGRARLGPRLTIPRNNIARSKLKTT